MLQERVEKGGVWRPVGNGGAGGEAEKNDPPRREG